MFLPQMASYKGESMRLLLRHTHQEKAGQHKQAQADKSTQKSQILTKGVRNKACTVAIRMNV